METAGFFFFRLKNCYSKVLLYFDVYCFCSGKHGGSEIRIYEEDPLGSLFQLHNVLSIFIAKVKEIIICIEFSNRNLEINVSEQ